MLCLLWLVRCAGWPASVCAQCAFLVGCCGCGGFMWLGLAGCVFSGVSGRNCDFGWWFDLCGFRVWVSCMGFGCWFVWVAICADDLLATFSKGYNIVLAYG